ncbi:MAG: DNA-binding protein WhiA [Acetivibrionales bacterium]
MSFSSTVKNELCRIENINNCCLLTELAAAICFNGTVDPSPDGGFSIRLATENAAFARRIYSTIKKACLINAEISMRKSRKLKKHISYTLLITPEAGSARMLEKAGVSIIPGGNGDDNDTGQTPVLACDKRVLDEPCCRKAFLRGAFLASGSISDPEKAYHLEVISRTRELAVYLTEILGSFGLNSRIISRKGNFVAYLKEGESIVDFLNITGAHNALMRLENVRILKDMRNSVNRIVNCETANLGKTVNASLRHVENIRYIADNIGFDKLSPGLREIAELRLAYTDASLAELGQMLSPPLGKSGVNHRLRKLDMIAEKHRKRA